MQSFPHVDFHNHATSTKSIYAYDIFTRATVWECVDDVGECAFVSYVRVCVNDPIR